MKKVVGILSLFILLLGVSVAQAEEPRLASSINGHDWVQTPHAEKLAFIEGINYAIAIDYEIEKIMIKDGKASVISPFEQAWINAFARDTTTHVVQRLDRFYIDNPDKRDMSIGRVVWYEIINPAK